MRYAQNKGYAYEICHREQDLLEKQYLKVTRMITEAETEYDDEIADLLLKLPDSLCFEKLGTRYSQNISILNQIAWYFK